MQRSRLTEEQMARILREPDASPVSEVAKRHRVSEHTIYARRKRYGEHEVADVRRLRALEGENARLKKMLAAAFFRRAGRRRSRYVIERLRLRAPLEFALEIQCGLPWRRGRGCDSRSSASDRSS